MKFQVTFAFLALAIGTQAATVANVLSDVSAISTDVNTLNTAINGFPASGLLGALVRVDRQMNIINIYNAVLKI